MAGWGSERCFEGRGAQRVLAEEGPGPAVPERSGVPRHFFFQFVSKIAGRIDAGWWW